MRVVSEEVSPAGVSVRRAALLCRLLLLGWRTLRFFIVVCLMPTSLVAIVRQCLCSSLTFRRCREQRVVRTEGELDGTFLRAGPVSVELIPLNGRQSFNVTFIPVYQHTLAKRALQPSHL